MTASVDVLPDGTKAAAIANLRSFDEFTPDNDPYGEHDFGTIDLDGDRFNFKIDYYAPDMLHGSADPADPAKNRACSHDHDRGGLLIRVADQIIGPPAPGVICWCCTSNRIVRRHNFEPSFQWNVFVNQCPVKVMDFVASDPLRDNRQR